MKDELVFLLLLYKLMGVPVLRSLRLWRAFTSAMQTNKHTCTVHTNSRSAIHALKSLVFNR